MKFKTCKIKLVSEDRNELINWIEQVKNEIFFKKVEASKIYECSFNMDNKTVKDYRVNISFISKASKNNIYWAMNQIKATPITFS